MRVKLGDHTLQTDRIERTLREGHRLKVWLHGGGILTLEWGEADALAAFLAAEAIDLMMEGRDAAREEAKAGDEESGDDEPDEPPTDDAPLDRFSEHLAIDINVSETSPVVKNTWITVAHVVSLIVDGWTWTDILRAHPELTTDDIRACLAYTVAEELTP